MERVNKQINSAAIVLLDCRQQPTLRLASLECPAQTWLRCREIRAVSHSVSWGCLCRHAWTYNGRTQNSTPIGRAVQAKSSIAKNRLGEPWIGCDTGSFQLQFVPIDLHCVALQTDHGQTTRAHLAQIHCATIAQLPGKAAKLKATVAMSSRLCTKFKHWTRCCMQRQRTAARQYSVASEIRCWFFFRKCRYGQRKSSTVYKTTAISLPSSCS